METVKCGEPSCGSTTRVKLDGTMPLKWFGVWIERRRRMVRVCSEDCLEKLRVSSP